MPVPVCGLPPTAPSTQLPPPSPSPSVPLPTNHKRPALPTTGSPVNLLVVPTAVSVVASTTPWLLSL